MNLIFDIGHEQAYCPPPDPTAAEAGLTHLAGGSPKCALWAA